MFTGHPPPMIRIFIAPQCRKWRIPVKTMAMLYSSAAAMTSSIAFGAARLNDRAYAQLGSRFESVAKWKERIRGEHRSGHIEF